VAYRGLIDSYVFFHFVPLHHRHTGNADTYCCRIAPRVTRPVRHFFRTIHSDSIWYAVGRSSLKQIPLHWTFWTPHQLAGRWLATLSLFPEFLPWLGIQAPWMKVFAILNLVVAIALTLVLPLCILSWTQIHTRYAGVLASAVLCGVAVIATGYEFRRDGQSGERFCIQRYGSGCAGS